MRTLRNITTRTVDKEPKWRKPSKPYHWRDPHLEVRQLHRKAAS